MANIDFVFDVALTSGGGTINIEAVRTQNIISITGNDTLSSNWTIQSSGTDVVGMRYFVVYDATMILNGNTIDIYGFILSDVQALTKAFMYMVYDGTDWDVQFCPHFGASGFVETSHIADDAIVTDKILDGEVTLRKIENIFRGSLVIGILADAVGLLDAKSDTFMLIGNGTDLNSVEITGAFSITNAGVSSLGADSVPNTALTDLLQGFIKIGNGSDRPVDVDFSGVGQIGVGDGTDYNSVPISGDTSLTSAGALTVNASAITEDKLGSETAGTETKGALVMFNKTDIKSLLNGSINPLFELNTGDQIVNVELFTSIVSASAVTVTMGGDTPLLGAANPAALLQAADTNTVGVYGSTDPALTFIGSQNSLGFRSVAADGFVTIQSSGDVSGSGGSFSARITVLTK